MNCLGAAFTGLMDKHQPRRKVKAATPGTVQHANELTQENQHITLEKMYAELNIGHRTAGTATVS
jgi:hypothetical protein